ncbi:MAG: metallophosphoesterase family protein [Chloroflexi bacterium]|nr:metallophosphoesterase family protein [Chloroflexota bacterium]
MKIGLLSDAHGNAVAVAACLRALDVLGVGPVYFLGDAVGYLSGERDVLRLLRARQVTCQRGNHEAMLLGELPVSPERERIYQLAAARQRLSADELADLNSWPDSRLIDVGGRRLRLLHGSPHDPLEGYVYPDADLSRFDGLPYDAIFMGHTHYPFVARRGDMLIVNVGSCGLPRDEGDMPAFAVYAAETHSCRIYRLHIDAASVLDRCGEGHVAAEVRACLERKSPRPIVGTVLDGGVV